MYGYVFTFLSANACAVLVLQWYQQPSYLSAVLWLCAATIVLAILYIIVRWQIFRYSALLCCACIVALWSVSRITHVPSVHTIDTYATKQTVTLQGIISNEPDRRPLQTKYTVDASVITLSGSVLPVNGKVLFTDKRQWPKYYIGDTVQIYGVLEQPGLVQGTFAYDSYLSRFGIYSVMYAGGIELVPNEVPLRYALWRWLFATKETFEAQINKLYPEPHASFIAGLLTGSRKGIPDAVLQDFQTTGLTHIIAISGYNITLIITLVVSALFWVPKKYQLLPAAITIILFTIFVGASAAVVRACIMGILGLLALHTQSQNSARITVLWALCIMVNINPKYLWYDAGFQLSFLAVIGLLELRPILVRFTNKIPNVLALRESMQLTIAAQIMAAPVLILLFSQLSLIAPIANVLVVPFIPLAMLFVSIGTIVSFVFYPLGQAIAYLGWLCLEYVIQIAHLLSAVPHANITIEDLSLYSALLYYAGLALVSYSVERK